MVAFKAFFRYVTVQDKIMMVIGSIAAVITGVLLPSVGVVVGEVTNSYSQDNNPHEIHESMQNLVGFICLVSGGIWFFGYVYYSFW